MKWILTLALVVLLTPVIQAQSSLDFYWIKIEAHNKYQRTELANLGISFEAIQDDYVIAFGGSKLLQDIQNHGFKTTHYPLHEDRAALDFPRKDRKFHNYKEITQAFNNLKNSCPSIVELETIGKSVEGRDIVAIHLSSGASNGIASLSDKPGVLFTGTHHAREHLSTELPLMLAQHLCEKYKRGDRRIKAIIEGRHVMIIPLVNPDGVEWDISSGRYKYWRKNRSHNHDNTRGVDLNRNYANKWGGEGASDNPSAENYHGPAPFSEPETQAIRDFVIRQNNISIFTSFHTFSKLILYPWGGSYNPIGNVNDRSTYIEMAQTMAKWNKYKPMQGADLYIATGDTCDWAYDSLGIFCFTFELDPGKNSFGNFYPGQRFIPIVFRKNLEPSLYMMELADNPYRVLNPHRELGFETPLF